MNIKKYYSIILKFLGFKFINKKESLDEIIINIDSDNNINQFTLERNKKWYDNKEIRLSINIFYISIIAVLIGWQFVYSIYLAINKNNVKFFTSNIFPLMFFSQYLLSIWYYKNIQFEKIIDVTNFYFNLMFLFSTVFSFLMPTVEIILLTNDKYIEVYTDIFRNATNHPSKIFLCLLLFLSKFYSYFIFFVNIGIFSLIFINHCLDISSYVDKLKKIVESDMKNLTLDVVVNDYTELKYYHSESVKIMNNIFSSITFFGFMASYFTFVNYGSYYIGASNYINIVYFVCIEIIYIYTITKVKKMVDDMKDIIHSQKFIYKFLSKSNIEHIVGDTYEGDNDSKKIHIIKEISFRNMIKSCENSQSLDWIVLIKKLDQPWENFKIFGFEIEDAEIIKKLVAILFGFLMILNFDPSRL
jgi:hypothetical protein